ncbi:MAG: 5-bromo-4-chloroindolyl phosphate hydrolysis family protein [Pseudorhodobacter sp.]
MAQKFGRKYSPRGASQATGPGAQSQGLGRKRPARAGFKSNLLFLLPFLFVWKAFRGEPSDLILGLVVFAAMIAGAWMTREGLIAEEAYMARRIARRPALPRKILGAVLTGVGLGAGAMMADQQIVIAALLGLIGAGLHLGAFGLDPLSDKGTEGIDSFQTDRVARAVEDAEKYLTGMKEAIQRTRDRGLEARVDQFVATARDLFRTVENDPRDLTAARKYLGVYLMGARDATVKFAELYARKDEPGIRADYEALLADLETTFASRTTAMLSNDHSDLNVEIEVLRERLDFENR